MKHKISLAVYSLTILSFPTFSLAVTIPNPLTSNNFQTLIEKLIDLVFTIGVTIAPIAIIIAGILFMTGEGDPGKIKTAKEIIRWTIIGLIILLCSKAIVTLIRTTIGG